jgi:regulatory protein
MRFEREVQEHLRKRGVSGEELPAALARLRELGAVSDIETSRAWIRDRLRFSPRSRSALRAELLRKGAAEDAVTAALEDLCPADGEVGVAVRALAKTAVLAGRLPEAVVRRRMWAQLARRGFDPGTVREAIARVLGDTEETE